MNVVLRYSIALAALLPLAAMGCSDRNPADLDVARALVDPIVFDDDYGNDVWYEPFSNTHYTAVTLDSVHAYEGDGHAGARSLKFNIPPLGSALGLYTGGVLRTGESRDLTDYDALTFYARTDVAGIVLNTAGFGNDNSGNSLYEVGRERVAIGQDWTFVVVPIPAPSRLIAERGLLTFAESLEEVGGEVLYPNGYNIWLDEIRFARRDDISVNIAFVGSQVRRYFVGSTVSPSNGTTRFDTDLGSIQLSHSSRYFDFESSEPSVAVPTERGEIRIVGEGTTTITGSLEGTPAAGQIIMHGHAVPSVAAARPTLAPAQVLSMFSDAYSDVPVASWRTDWSDGNYREFRVAGQATKMYYDLNYVGVDFSETLLDASAMNGFHIDVYAPNGSNFILKLVSFPGSLSEPLEVAVTFDANSSPAFTPGVWSPLEVDLGALELPAGWDWSRMGQLVLQASFDVQLLLVDNVYWHK